MKRTTVVVAILAVAGGLSFAGETHTLSGTFTHSGVDDGTKGYLKLIDPVGSCMDPGPGDFSAMATFAGGEAPYSIEGVTEGLYTACAFIDANAQEGQVRADSGDYGSLRPVEIEDDTTLDFDEDAWTRIP
jgi:hypothetical protein